MKAIIEVDVPDYQICQEVSIYFKDTMMIKGIVQEPSGDLISRQAVLDGIEELKGSPWFNDNTNGARIIRREALNVVEDLCIRDLPSVTPTERTGHWIPVSERLPEEGSYVLVCCKDGDIWTDDYYSYGFDDCKDDVTAWMPLPAPYEGSDTE